MKIRARSCSPSRTRMASPSVNPLSGGSPPLRERQAADPGRQARRDRKEDVGDSDGPRAPAKILKGLVVESRIGREPAEKAGRQRHAQRRREEPGRQGE